MMFNLELSFGPIWDNIGSVRRFIDEMLSIDIISKNESKSVAIVASELMENLVKYSALGGAKIIIQKDSKLGLITLRISNLASMENINNFIEIYNDINEGSSKDAYKKMMLKSISNPNKSQLGLARIRYECHGEISYKVYDEYDDTASNLCIEKDMGNIKLLNIRVEIPVKLSNKTTDNG